MFFVFLGARETPSLSKKFSKKLDLPSNRQTDKQKIIYLLIAGKVGTVKPTASSPL
jgi:hypothetical protein